MVAGDYHGTLGYSKTSFCKLMLRALRLRPGRPARVLRGHPWAFLGEIDLTLGTPPADGDHVELTDLKGRCLGAGVWNGRSQIAWRRYSRRPIPLDATLLEDLIKSALKRREGKLVARLVWSEADSLPGLVVDRFHDLLSVQTLTLGMEQRLPIILEILQRHLRPREIVLKNDAATRKLEGMDTYVRTVSGKPLEPSWMEVGGVQWRVDLLGGQKTGLYLDQIEQHAHVAQWAKGRRVLDTFCNQGGFGLACARAGATSVLGLDSSEEAIQAAQAAATRNQLAARFEVANVFDWFTEHREEVFDLIILDPPPFARSKDSVEGALRGYKELNLRALRLLAPGGILATYSCSHRVTEEMYLEVIEAAAADARREAIVLERTSQPADHPVLVNFPESRYLKGFLIEIRA
jgi:23S rRNA (cytosine1962-C5)-methyltransferase